MPITRGPRAVRTALIEAAADLFADKGDATIRAVAARAGVNHGLVHHYFGSKASLRAAVLSQLSTTIDQKLELPEDGSLLEIGLAALRVTDSDPRYVKILGRTLLDGELPEQLQTTFPVVERLREAAPNDALAARAGIAEGLALALGVAVFGPWIRAALDLSEAELDAARDGALARICAELESQSQPARSEAP